MKTFTQINNIRNMCFRTSTGTIKIFIQYYSMPEFLIIAHYVEREMGKYRHKLKVKHFSRVLLSVFNSIT